ncbi:MAG: TOBE domain-containing protein, partial [Pseudomonadota bacterium]|nr:TOBE domain-containing protein [Pseudomonadota bacterium]
VTERDSQWQLLRLDFNGGHLWLRDSGESIGQCVRIRILARDVSLSIADEQASSILNRLPARVIDMAGDTDRAMLMVRLSIRETILLARISKKSASQLKLHQNQRLWVQIKSVAVLH